MNVRLFYCAVVFATVVGGGSRGKKNITSFIEGGWV
jgi:hypothetical protein